MDICSCEISLKCFMETTIRTFSVFTFYFSCFLFFSNASCLCLFSLADHAQPHAWVSECTLHLWVSIQTSLPLHALGTLHLGLFSSWVWKCDTRKSFCYRVTAQPPVLSHILIYISQSGGKHQFGASLLERAVHFGPCSVRSCDELIDHPLCHH